MVIPPLQEIEAIEAAIEELRVKRQGLKRKFDDQVHLYKYASQTWWYVFVLDTL